MAGPLEVRYRTDAPATRRYFGASAPTGAVPRKGFVMSSRPRALALLLPVLALLLGGCQRNEPPPTVIVAPGPAGEPGTPGAPGATGEPGKTGATAVVVVTPPASAASV